MAVDSDPAGFPQGFLFAPRNVHPGRNLSSACRVMMVEERGGVRVRSAQEEQMNQVAGMDEAAFRRLYELHLPDLLRYAYYRTRNRADAEDVVALVFLRAWEHLPRYQERGIPFVHWLYRIAGNAIKSGYRRREQPGGLEPERAPASSQLELELTPDRLDLLRQLACLPETQQQVLILRYVQDLSLLEVARIMDRSPNAIKQLAFRALQNMRERMGDDA